MKNKKVIITISIIGVAIILALLIGLAISNKDTNYDSQKDETEDTLLIDDDDIVNIEVFNSDQYFFEEEDRDKDKTPSIFDKEKDLLDKMDFSKEEKDLIDEAFDIIDENIVLVELKYYDENDELVSKSEVKDKDNLLKSYCYSLDMEIDTYAEILEKIINAGFEIQYIEHLDTDGNTTIIDCHTLEECKEYALNHGDEYFDVFLMKDDIVAVTFIHPEDGLPRQYTGETTADIYYFTDWLIFNFYD